MNFKVKCINGISPGEFFTTNKIYEVKEGKITFDSGKKSDRIIQDLKELHRRMLSKFELIKDSTQIIIHTKGRDTVAMLKNGNTVIKSAKAICNPSDTFDFKVGAKLAFERLMWNEVKEVKRHAKVGEYVKVVNAGNVPNTNGKDEYRNGDILMIINTRFQARYAEGNAGDGRERILYEKEYVVLENYTPSIRPTIDYSAIDYSTIDYAKLDGAKLFEEIQRRVNTYEI